MYPGELDRLFQRILGWPAGDGTCLVSIGGDPRFSGNLDSVAGLYDVAEQSGYPRNVVNLEQSMDAPSDQDVRTLVESSRGESQSEHGRRDLVRN